MEELQDLVRIISQERLKKVDILNNPDTHKDGRSRISRFYHGIFNGNIKNDNDARKVLGYKKGDSGYPLFKFRFRRKIYNSLFFIDMSGRDLSDYDRAANECSRAQHQARVLIWFYARNSAIRFCETMLAKAEKYELAEFAVFFLRKLLQKTMSAGKKHDFHKYSKKLGFWLQRWEAEENAIMAFYNLEIEYSNTISTQPEAARLAMKSANKIEANLKTQDSYILRLHLYRLKGIANYILGNFQKSNDAWHTLEDYIIANPQYKADVRLGEAALQMMTNYLHLGDDKQAYECSIRSVNYFGKGSINQMIFYENFILLLMHKGRYKDAAKTLDFTLKEIPIKEMPEFHEGRWKLVEAYLYLALGKDYQTIISRPFKFSKIINEIRSIVGDKKGLNLSLLILETCIYLKEENDKALFDNMQALKLYKGRYIRIGGSKRTQIFIRMLLILGENNYDHDKALKTSIPWIKKLHDTPYRHSGSFEGLEVIPFENLWDMVLGFLK